MILNYWEWLMHQILQTRGISSEHEVKRTLQFNAMSCWSHHLAGATLCMDKLGCRPLGLWQVPNWIQACVLCALIISKANCILHWKFYWREWGWLMEGRCYPSLLGTGEVAPGLMSSFWDLSPRRMWRNLERIQEEGAGDVEYVACKEGCLRLTFPVQHRRG